jgi:hypothetical protein
MRLGGFYVKPPNRLLSVASGWFVKAGRKNTDKSSFVELEDYFTNKEDIVAHLCSNGFDWGFLDKEDWNDYLLVWGCDQIEKKSSSEENKNSTKPKTHATKSSSETATLENKEGIETEVSEENAEVDAAAAIKEKDESQATTPTNKHKAKPNNKASKAPIEDADAEAETETEAAKADDAQKKADTSVEPAPAAETKNTTAPSPIPACVMSAAASFSAAFAGSAFPTATASAIAREKTETATVVAANEGAAAIGKGSWVAAGRAVAAAEATVKAMLQKSIDKKEADTRQEEADALYREAELRTRLFKAGTRVVITNGRGARMNKKHPAANTLGTVHFSYDPLAADNRGYVHVQYMHMGQQVSNQFPAGDVKLKSKQTLFPSLSASAPPSPAFPLGFTPNSVVPSCSSGETKPTSIAAETTYDLIMAASLRSSLIFQTKMRRKLMFLAMKIVFFTCLHLI